MAKPVDLRYEDLNLQAQDRVRVIHGGDASPVPIRLEADGRHELHPFQEKNLEFELVEFAVPREATADGLLTLRLTMPTGLGGNGRGVQVCAMWLLRGDSVASQVTGR